MGRRLFSVPVSRASAAPLTLVAADELWRVMSALRDVCAKSQGFVEFSSPEEAGRAMTRDRAFMGPRFVKLLRVPRSEVRRPTSPHLQCGSSAVFSTIASRLSGNCAPSSGQNT